jgi:haloacetate dehalogenase
MRRATVGSSGRGDGEATVMAMSEQRDTRVSSIDGLDSRFVETSIGPILARVGGSGSPLLLLHGFPETGLMWQRIAPILSEHFTIIAVDLPGYGASACPPDSVDHSAMSKRAMARYLVEAMQSLGFPTFAVAGHDRGGRVAYRMALDHPEVVTRLSVLDVVPTAEVWDRADARLALGFWPFSLLAQPAPLPERLLLSAPDAVIDDALGQWGSPTETFPSPLREAYIAALRSPEHVHAICEEYRAAASIDREHDEADRRANRKLSCPVLALWSGKGALDTWYAEAGGPLAIWRQWANAVQGRPMNGGHFFPEELAAETAELMLNFFRN